MPLVKVSLGVVDDVPPCIVGLGVDRCEIIRIFKNAPSDLFQLRLCGHEAEWVTKRSRHWWWWNPDGTCGCRERECFVWAQDRARALCPFEVIPESEAFRRAVVDRYWWASVDDWIIVPLSEAQAWVAAHS